MGPKSLEVPLPQADALLTSFTSFLTAAIHTILYYRTLYPQRTFLTTRAYNLPVHQSRHPAVCTWISDAVAAVTVQIRAGAVSRVALVIHGPVTLKAAVLERWVFDVAAFPAWPGEGREKEEGKGDEEESGVEEGGEGDDDEEEEDEEEEEDDEEDEDTEGLVNFVDVDEQLRGALRRIAYTGEKLGDLPVGCTFTVAVELRDGAPAPLVHPQPWIPTKLDEQRSAKARRQRSKKTSSDTTTPILSVDAGPLFFECWVEEGKAKENLSTSQSHPKIEIEAVQPP